MESVKNASSVGRKQLGRLKHRKKKDAKGNAIGEPRCNDRGGESDCSLDLPPPPPEELLLNRGDDSDSDLPLPPYPTPSSGQLGTKSTALKKRNDSFMAKSLSGVKSIAKVEPILSKMQEEQKQLVKQVKEKKVYQKAADKAALVEKKTNQLMHRKSKNDDVREQSNSSGLDPFPLPPPPPPVDLSPLKRPLDLRAPNTAQQCGNCCHNGSLREQEEKGVVPNGLESHHNHSTVTGTSSNNRAGFDCQMGSSQNKQLIARPQAAPSDKLPPPPPPPPPPLPALQPKEQPPTPTSSTNAANSDRANLLKQIVEGKKLKQVSGLQNEGQSRNNPDSLGMASILAAAMDQRSKHVQGWDSSAASDSSDQDQSGQVDSDVEFSD